MNKWVKYINKQEVDSLPNDIQLNNLHAMRSVSIQLQNYIRNSCAKVSEILKVLDLKLKEISTLDDKLKQMKLNSNDDEQEEGAIRKTKKLEKHIQKEKKQVKKIMQKLRKSQKKLIKKGLKAFDKSFVKKNKGNIQDLFTSINLILKGQMTNPSFKQSFQKFTIFVITQLKGLTGLQLKNPQQTAQMLIDAKWNSYLKEAEIEQKKNTDSIKKDFKELEDLDKKINRPKSKKGKRAPVKKIK